MVMSGHVTIFPSGNAGAEFAARVPARTAFASGSVSMGRLGISYQILTGEMALPRYHQVALPALATREGTAPMGI